MAGLLMAGQKRLCRGPSVRIGTTTVYLTIRLAIAMVLDTGCLHRPNARAAPRDVAESERYNTILSLK